MECGSSGKVIVLGSLKPLHHTLAVKVGGGGSGRKILSAVEKFQSSVPPDPMLMLTGMATELTTGGGTNDKPMVFTTTLLLIAMIALLNLVAIRARTRLRRKFVGGTF